MPKRPILYFAYVKPISFSGQSAASDLIINQLSCRGWDCRPVYIYPLDRAIENPLRRYARFFSRMLATWLRFWGLVFRRDWLLHLNLGQSFGSFCRVGIGYFPLRILRPNARVVVSLHGSIFMQWRPEQWITRVFLCFLKSARYVTVLGEKQKNKLLELGVDERCIRVVPNTCEIAVMDDASAEAKQAPKPEEPVRILHLSLLIESKGYPEYLEALELLAQREIKRPIQAVLCGPMSFSAQCTRFTTESSKEAWILDKIESIREHSNGRISIEWVRGAFGDEKRKLFEEAEIFVFPSRFPVEAQPLVLLEAMAAGCALITSTVGEIPSTVNDQCAVLLEDPTPEGLAGEMEQLVESPERRQTMGRQGVVLMRGPFSPEVYAETWEEIFTSMSPHN